jgi:hypothetical protein
MSLNPLYITSINLQEYLVDKNTGLPLSNGYLEFWQDTSRTTPKIVYQLTGSPPNYTYSPLSNPVRLSGVGVPTDANDNQVHIYYYPYDDDGNLQLYYVSVYSEDATLQYTLEAWPNVTETTSPADQNNSTGNQLSNSQFVKINFIAEEGLIIESDVAVSAKSYFIAPDWELIVTSTGAFTIEINQIALAGSLNIPTNPPDKLTFQPEGNNITDLKIRQRLPNNPSIWSADTNGGGYLSGIMLIQSLDGQAQTISMEYVQSDGTADPQVIVSGSTSTTGYQLLNDTILLNAGSNTESGEEAQVFIDIILPTSGYYSLTSIQVVGLNDDNIEVVYEQETTNRQIDHLFHYYKPQLDFKPIRSYLCAWNFPLNPAQIYGSSTSVGSEASNYVWDQTIIWQSVASSISVTRDTTGDIKGSLNIEVGSTCQFAVIQYLTVPQIIDVLSNPLSSNILFSSNQASLKGVISLWYTKDLTLPNINNEGKSLILSVNSEGKPSTFNGNWFEIPRSNFGDAIFTKNSSTDLNVLNSFGFNGWDFSENTNDDNIDDVTYFAMVIGFSSVTETNNVVIKDCSLVPGYIPTISAPQTANEVLDDSEYYYEKSYDNDTLPGTITYAGALYNSVSCFYDGTNTDTPNTSFTINFRKPKVTIPVYNTDPSLNFVIFYSAINTNISNAYVMTTNLGPGTLQFTFTSGFSLASSSHKCIQFDATGGSYPQRGGAFSGTGSEIFQFTIDTRLGIY